MRGFRRATRRLALSVVLGPGALAAPAVGGVPPAAAAAPCVPGRAPGEVVWSVPAAVNSTLRGPAVFGDDGATYVAVVTAEGIAALDCAGVERWSFDFAGRLGSAMDFQQAHHPMVVGDDGTLYVGTLAFEGESPGAVVALTADGKLRWVYRGKVDAVQFAGALGLDAAGRPAVGAGSFSDVTGGTTNDGQLMVLDAFGRPLPGFPVTTNPLSIAPATLADGRLVFLANRGPGGAALPSPTRTATPPPSATATATARATSTPTPTDTPAATGTMPPSPAPRPALAHLPWVWRSGNGREPGDMLRRGGGDRASGGSRRRLAAGAGSAQAADDEPTPTPAVLQSASTVVYVVDPAQPPGMAFAIDGLVGKPPVAVGDVAIFEVLRDERRQLVAVDLAAVPPRERWAYALTGRTAGTPLVGRVDPATGRAELIFVDLAGILTALDVPIRSSAGGQPRFRWARRVTNPGTGSPVLGDAGVIYIATRNGVAAFERDDGAPLWAVDLAPARPISSLALSPGGLLLVWCASIQPNPSVPPNPPMLFAIATESGGLDPDAAWPVERRDGRNTGRAVR